MFYNFMQSVTLLSVVCKYVACVTCYVCTFVHYVHYMYAFVYI